MNQKDDKQFLDRAARAALRGVGFVEPNPLVGALLVKGGAVIGIGHHQRYGSLHAEREAIGNCLSQGHDPRGATLYCTLEPCCHFGKQPPCTQAVIDAGIARVVLARRDPSELSGGGIQILRDAGVDVRMTDASELATGISDPFVHRLRSGRPWVIAKWAQTLDGRIATRTGESQWITSALSRRRVHRLRGRVDAVMVGIGTAIADDPMLTARDVRLCRRVARRVVLDSQCRLSGKSKLAATADRVPTTVCCVEGASCGLEHVDCIHAGAEGGRVDLAVAMGKLFDEGVASVLVEAGARVLGSFIEEDLIDEAIVHIAPGVLGDEQALAVATGRRVESLELMRRFRLVRTKAVGDDVELHYRRCVMESDA